MDRYSRLVAFLKVLLPLAALGLLSTLFLLSRGVDPDAAIPFQDAEIAERVRGQRVTEPYFAGVTDAGDEISFTAAIARPAQDGEPAQATDLIAQIHTQDGARITLSSDTGLVALTMDQATFDGAVQIRTSTGFALDSDQLVAGLKQLTLHSPGPVTGQGPFGSLSSGAMTLKTQAETEQVHILFTQGVKLLYDPKQVER